MPSDPSTLLLQPASMPWRLLFLLFLLGITQMTQAAGAPISLDAVSGRYDLNPVIEVLEDPGGKLNLADIQSKTVAEHSFEASSGGLSSFGFTNSAYWFRFSLSNPSPQARQMVLVLRAAWLDSIDFYQPTAVGNYSQRRFGDTLPFSQREHVHPQFLIDLLVEPGTHIYYLRISSQQAFMTPIELWEPEAFHRSDRLLGAYFGMFYGIMLVMVLYNGFIGLSTRDRNHLYYCLYLLAFVAMNFSYNGFAFQYLWPDSPRWLNWSYSSWIFLFQVVAILFAMTFLESRTRLPRMHKVLKVFLSAMLGTWFFTMASGNQLLYNASAVYFIFFMSPLISMSGITAWLAGYKAARFFVLASMASLLGSFITALTVSGFLPYSFSSFHAAEFGILVDVVLLSLALADRINVLREQKNAAELGVIEQKLLTHAWLEKAKNELEHTVQERTAELAKARDEAEHLARMDMLTGISNRRHFEEVSTQEFAWALRYRHPLSMILFDIDFFKLINDTYGHAVGDQVIKRVANAARDAVRELDLVGRIGGEEFAILLPEASMGQAIMTAERLREQIANLVFDHEGHTIGFTASFGVTQIGDGDKGIDTLLQRADQMMYAAKAAGRNRVCATPASFYD
ncbi:diguanylate cyclase [Rhodoferax sp.]|uniref:sensor domain-containing diguanylate cyclase n=1 Tax=Rhodoferax sp. TaxID=50421 RepID=UPI002852C29B|nr:diguanylate cyclase [Rhodoferax sp.]